MATYILLFVMLEAKQLQKVFQMTAITVQVISFLSALFALILFFARVLILFKVGDRSYSYGVLNGRVWGIVNPNASAIFTYISIVLALYLIHQGHKYSVYFKINNIIQVIYFALMQSRGALLSLLLMIGLYFAFVARGNIVKRLISFLTVAILVFGTNVGISFAASKYITSSRATVFNFDKTTKISDNASSSSEVANELHLIETTPSGRTNIWKNALKMGSVKPVFGYGVRNVPNYYSQYFSKYEIQNSLIGGNFHNIFITVFVSSGIVGLVAFMMLLGYIIQRFVRYLFISKKNSDKLVMILFFGMLLGQLFESQIMYSTNFINIMFWFVAGYGLMICNRDEKIRYQEVTDVREIQQMELGIMEYIHEVCNKIGVKYFLAYGSLIGAVRHQGFIPWDDDMDICMLRDDYEKLQDYLIANPSERYQVMSYKNNRNYVYPFMKVMDNQTYLIEEDVRIDSNMGIYVDIFPLDYYDDKYCKPLIRYNELYRYLWLIYGHGARKHSVYSLFHIVRSGKECFHINFTAFLDISVFKLLQLPARYLIDKFQNRLMNAPKSNYFWLYSIISCESFPMPIEWFGEGKMMAFENIEVCMPNNYDAYLTRVYGDYMTPPPIEKRPSHHARYFVDFHRRLTIDEIREIKLSK